MFHRFFKFFSLKPTQTDENISTKEWEVRCWNRRFATLNGIFWGILITMLSVGIIRDYLQDETGWFSPTSYLLCLALLSIPSIPLGLFLSRKFTAWGSSRNDAFEPSAKIEPGQFRVFLLRVEENAICCIVVSITYRLFPDVPRMIYAIAMTFSICLSLGAFLLAAWAAVLQPNRYHFIHIFVGMILVGATAALWITAFETY